MTEEPQKEPTPAPFEYELECAYCGTLHKPALIQPKDDKSKVVWKPNCVKCGKQNELIFHPLKYRRNNV